MICTSCKAAAVYGNAYKSQQFVIMAQGLHSECSGNSWCDCQHRIGKWTN